MTVVRCDDYSPYGMACPQCNDLMIAPSRSAYVSCNSAHHCWSCDTCGHDVEIFDRFVRLSGVEDSILEISNLECSSPRRHVVTADDWPFAATSQPCGGWKPSRCASKTTEWPTDPERAIARLARQHHFAQMKKCSAVWSLWNRSDKRSLSANVDQRMD